MPHRSFSVPHLLNAKADQQQPVNIGAPPLSGSLAYEMQLAIPRLETVLAEELSSQTASLCIELLKSWVAAATPEKKPPPQQQVPSINQQPILSLTRSRVSRWLLSSLARKKPIAPAKDISEPRQDDQSGSITPDLSAATSSEEDNDLGQSSSSVCIQEDDHHSTPSILFHHDFELRPSSGASSMASTSILESATAAPTPPHHPTAPFAYPSLAHHRSSHSESPTTTTPILRPAAAFVTRYSSASSTSSHGTIRDATPSAGDGGRISTSSDDNGGGTKCTDGSTLTTTVAIHPSKDTTSTAAAAVAVAATAAAAATKLPRAKTTISGFLNKLGMSVKKAMGRQHRRAHPALETDTTCVDSITSPLAADSTNTDMSISPSSSHRGKEPWYDAQDDDESGKCNWDQEEIWRPRIEPNSREAKGKGPVLHPDTPASTPLGDDYDDEHKRQIPRKPVQYTTPGIKHSKTDMDILREQSVPFIKMGLGHGFGQDGADDNDDNGSCVDARFPSGIHELQQWHQRFHELQQHPDKLEANLQRVTAAVFKIIENNHAAEYFEFDEKGFRGTPLGHMHDKLFASEPLTSPEDIYDQMAYVVECGQLTSEHVILAYVYLERMVDRSDQALCDVSWRFMLLAAMIVAVKVWDDCAVYNHDFVQIFPELDIKLVNKIERHFLKAIKYDVGCTPAHFVSTYFDLRDGFHL